ncbi:MAG: Eco57I restriction-modification methylase domain-containing protein [Promethearchaeota archaeon]
MYSILQILSDENIKQIFNQISQDFRLHSSQLKLWLKQYRETFSNIYKDVDPSDEEKLIDTLIMTLILSLLITDNLEQILELPSYDPPSISTLSNIAERKNIQIDQKIIKLLDLSIDTASRLGLDFQNLRSLAQCLNKDEYVIDDKLGTIIQNQLSSKLRKSLAANYTSTFSAKLVSALALDNEFESVIDPFAGSGRLLTSLLEEISIREKRIFHITSNELLEIAALLTTVRLLYFYKKHKLRSSLSIFLGDAFDKVSSPLLINSQLVNSLDKYNLVIMNPPFTRYLRLTRKFLNNLQLKYKRYKQYMTSQMGLHIFALFLADSVLLPGGRIAAVLPAPTFYSKYSTGIMKFLLKNYNIKLIVGITTDKSFSEGSDFKEIIFIADKRSPKDPQHSTATFATLSTELSLKNYQIIAELLLTKNTTKAYPIKYSQVPASRLKNEWNWIRFLEQGRLQELSDKLKSTVKIIDSQKLGLRIIRGFEMYGPEFFFLPNKDWRFHKERENEITFIHRLTKQKCSFAKQILQPALRKPSLYTSSISPKVSHFVLRVPPEYTNLVPKEYIAERKKNWQVAKNRFGKVWLNHIDNQLNSKQPFGHLFVVDKFGVTSTGTIIHYVDEKTTISKNFYLFDCPKNLAEFLGAWMSSTFFLLLFLASRREIGGAFGRLQIVDYKTEDLFLDPSSIPQENQLLILEKFKKIRNTQLPPLKVQINWSARSDLDHAFLDGFKLQKPYATEFLNEIYLEISHLFKEVEKRGKKRRGRE